MKRARGERRRVAAAASTLVIVSAAIACSGEVVDAPELLVVVDSDMAPPKDFDAVRVEVSSGGLSLHDESYDIGRGAHQYLLPASLGIRPGSGPASVDVKVTATLGGTPVVTQEARTVVPTTRVAELPMFLSYLCKAKTSTGADGSAISTCGDGQTCRGGDCAPADVDVNGLPDYATPNDASAASCFDTLACFATPITEPLDAACTAPLPAGADLAHLNVAVVNGANGTGICGGSVCLVPLNQERVPGNGYTIANGRIQIPTGFCADAKNVTVAVATSPCPAKTESWPTCGPWSSTGNSGDGGTPAITLDGASDASDVTDASDANAPDVVVGNDFTMTARFPRYVPQGLTVPGTLTFSPPSNQPLTLSTTLGTASGIGFVPPDGGVPAGAATAPFGVSTVAATSAVTVAMPIVATDPAGKQHATSVTVTVDPPPGSATGRAPVILTPGDQQRAAVWDIRLLALNPTQIAVAVATSESLSDPTVAPETDLFELDVATAPTQPLTPLHPIVGQGTPRLAIQGSTLLVATASKNAIFLARYAHDAALTQDKSFGPSGDGLLTISGGTVSLGGIAVDADETIGIAFALQSQPQVRRFDPDAKAATGIMSSTCGNTPAAPEIAAPLPAGDAGELAIAGVALDAKGGLSRPQFLASATAGGCTTEPAYALPAQDTSYAQVTTLGPDGTSADAFFLTCTTPGGAAGQGLLAHFIGYALDSKFGTGGYIVGATGTAYGGVAESEYGTFVLTEVDGSGNASFGPRYDTTGAAHAFAAAAVTSISGSHVPPAAIVFGPYIALATPVTNNGHPAVRVDIVNR